MMIDLSPINYPKKLLLLQTEIKQGRSHIYYMKMKRKHFIERRNGISCCNNIVVEPKLIL